MYYVYICVIHICILVYCRNVSTVQGHACQVLCMVAKLRRFLSGLSERSSSMEADSFNGLIERTIYQWFYFTCKLCKRNSRLTFWPLLCCIFSPSCILQIFPISKFIRGYDQESILTQKLHGRKIDEGNVWKKKNRGGEAKGFIDSPGKDTIRPGSFFRSNFLSNDSEHHRLDLNLPWKKNKSFTKMSRHQHHPFK